MSVSDLFRSSYSFYPEIKMPEQPLKHLLVRTGLGGKIILSDLPLWRTRERRVNLMSIVMPAAEAGHELAHLRPRRLTPPVPGHAPRLVHPQHGGREKKQQG